MLAEGTERNKDRSQKRFVICKISTSFWKDGKKIASFFKGHYYLISKEGWMFCKRDKVRINLRILNNEILKKYFCLVKGNKRKRRIG
jgi:hypothetical protein